MMLPQKYKENMKEILGSDYEKYINSLTEERYYGLRTNDIKINSLNFKNISQFKLTPIEWTNNGYYYSKEIQPAKHPYYYAGLYYIQEPSAMLPGEILPIEEGDKVLDLCAAPGGKSTQLGAKLNNTGLLVCNDISPSRTKGVVKNIEMFGITNSIIMSESPKKMETYFTEFFDKVLIDAPCSGEGMFRKEPSMLKHWNEDINLHYADIQKDILLSGAKMLKQGGYLVYSTCTFSLEENEKVIDWFINENSNFELINIPCEYGIENGIVNNEIDNDLNRAARLWPHKIKGEGHFVALLHKKEKEMLSLNNNFDFNCPNEKDIIEYIKFEEEILNIKLDRKRMTIINGNLYLLPILMPNIKGLRVLKTGLNLGELKKKRFEPSQAFASSLKINDVKNVVNIPVDSIDVIKYLKGETLELEANNGFNLVCVDNFSLGWAKKVNKLLKNKYSTGWRWM